MVKFEGSEAQKELDGKRIREAGFGRREAGLGLRGSRFRRVLADFGGNLVVGVVLNCFGCNSKTLDGSYRCNSFKLAVYRVVTFVTFVTGLPTFGNALCYYQHSRRYFIAFYFKILRLQRLQKLQSGKQPVFRSYISSYTCQNPSTASQLCPQKATLPRSYRGYRGYSFSCQNVYFLHTSASNSKTHVRIPKTAVTVIFDSSFDPQKARTDLPKNSSKRKTQGPRPTYQPPRLVCRGASRGKWDWNHGTRDLRPLIRFELRLRITNQFMVLGYKLILVAEGPALCKLCAISL